MVRVACVDIFFHNEGKFHSVGERTSIEHNSVAKACVYHTTTPPNLLWHSCICLLQLASGVQVWGVCYVPAVATLAPFRFGGVVRADPTRHEL